MIRKTQLAVAVAALISAPAFAAVGFDANVELDNTYRNNARGIEQSGRVELNAFSKSDKGGGFVAGRASYMANKDHPFQGEPPESVSCRQEKPTGD